MRLRIIERSTSESHIPEVKSWASREIAESRLNGDPIPKLFEFRFAQEDIVLLVRKIIRVLDFDPKSTFVFHLFQPICWVIISQVLVMTRQCRTPSIFFLRKNLDLFGEQQTHRLCTTSYFLPSLIRLFGFGAFCGPGSARAFSMRRIHFFVERRGIRRLGISRLAGRLASARVFDQLSKSIRISTRMDL